MLGGIFYPLNCHYLYSGILSAAEAKHHEPMKTPPSMMKALPCSDLSVWMNLSGSDIGLQAYCDEKRLDPKPGITFLALKKATIFPL